MRNYGSEHFFKNGPNSHMGFPGSSAGKEYTCNAGDLGSVPGSGRTTGEGIGYPLQYSWALLVAQLVKNPPSMRETWVQGVPGLGKSPGEWNIYPLQYSCLNSMDCIVHESQRVGHN